MLTYLKNFYLEAKGKLTTYLALGSVGLSEMADNAQQLHDSIPELRGYLPQGPTIEHIAHIALVVSGFGIVWSRVRRLIATPKSTP